MLATILLISIYLLNSTPLKDKYEPLSKPVEIVVALTKDAPQKIIHPEEPKPLEPSEVQQVEQAITLEPVAKKPPKTVPTEPKEVKPDVVRKKQAKVTQLPVPLSKKKRRFALKEAPSPQTITAKAPPIKRQPAAKKITMSPPAARKRNYQRKDTNGISQIQQTSEKTDFASKKTNTSIEAIANKGRQERRYHSRRQMNEKSKAPQLKTSTPIIAFNRSEETANTPLPGAHLVDRRYGSEASISRSSTQTASLSKDRPVSFQHQGPKKTTGIKPHKPARTFTKRSPTSPAASKGTEAAINFSAPRQQIEHVGTKSPKRRQSDGRYVFQKNHQYSTQTPQGSKQEFLFQSQKREEKKSTLVPRVSAKLRPKETRAVKQTTGSLANTHDFSDTITLDEIDPSELISLKEFTVCKDPEKEFRQKTQLAVHLHRPSRFETEGVLFFINYTESGYTIQIDIYNPQGRPFKTRCDVMQLALDKIVNRIK
jgi:hypothetical protein